MTDIAARPPTPQGISRLLRAANFIRSESTGRHSVRSGFVVSRSHSQDNAVKVTHRFLSMGNTAAQHTEKLSVYAAVLEEAGWSCRIAGRHLTVTAREA